MMPSATQRRCYPNLNAIKLFCNIRHFENPWIKRKIYNWCSWCATNHLTLAFLRIVILIGHIQAFITTIKVWKSECLVTLYLARNTICWIIQKERVSVFHCIHFTSFNNHQRKLILFICILWVARKSKKLWHSFWCFLKRNISNFDLCFHWTVFNFVALFQALKDLLFR